MLWQMQLIPEARREYNGRCVAHQLVAAVRERDRATDSRNARPVWTLDDIEAVLDDIEFELYPGHYEGQEPPTVPDDVRETLEAYIPLWIGGNNERARAYFCPRSRGSSTSSRRLYKQI
jgi:hypothetical protein